MSDVIADLTRLFRLGRKVATGEVLMGDLAEDAVREAGEQRSSQPATEKAVCSKTAGCTEGRGHAGQCCINV